VIQDYIVLMGLFTYRYQLPSPLQDATRAWYTISPWTYTPPTAEDCTRLSFSNLPFLSGAIAVDEVTKKDWKLIKSITKSLRSALFDTLPHWEWIDKKTRKALRKKVRAILYKTGEPDWAATAASLDAYYADVR
jgi:hypothetical protein